MDRLRLDPDDPLASVIAWLAALAQMLGIEALGIDPSAIRLKVRLNQAGAAFVRRTLADWRRQLSSLVRAEAGRLAARLARTFPLMHSAKRRLARLALAPHNSNTGAEERLPSPRVGEGPGLRGGGEGLRQFSLALPASADGSILRRHPSPQPLSHKGRGEDVPARLRRAADASLSIAEARPLSLPAAPPERGSTILAAEGRARPARDAWISDAEDAALRRRQRALMRGMRDRSALVRRLAHRLALKLARRRARANAMLAGLRGRRRFPHPPRAIGALHTLAPAPELRPPDGLPSVHA